MELSVAINFIKRHIDDTVHVVRKSVMAERYYRKQNDILYMKDREKKEEAENPLRNADNRIPSNFYKLQVNQKAAYAFTSPPQFDVGEDSANVVVKECLGDAFAKKCKSLCVQAANCSVAWIHYWVDKDGGFNYQVVDSKQIIPIWTKGLEKDLYAVIRHYSEIDDKIGKEYIVYEVWNDVECAVFRKLAEAELEDLEYYNAFAVLDLDTNETAWENVYQHAAQRVPFIFFNNNDEMQSDLSDIKELIDTYDKIYSGFVNDLEDIQQLIFILTNYGGDSDNALEILREMKQAKIINVESEGAEDRSGVSTLAIEIPVEARKEMLQITRKAIFEQGMAIDPDPQNFGNSSGVALKYLYALLELKTGMMQTEFSISFNHLIREILIHNNKTAKSIVQTWTRTAVNNDLELADIALKSKNVISDETILRNHPWVEDPEDEITKLIKQREELEPDWDHVPPPKGDDIDE